MTLATLRARIRRLTADDEESGEGGELNLVPFLDIITNILLFLFATLSFSAALASVPVAGVESILDGGRGEGAAAPLELTLRISPDGYTLSGRGAVLYQDNIPGRLPTLPKVAGAYDTDGLNRLTREIKRTFPEETSIRVSAHPAIPYETVVAALDAVRGAPGAPLFNAPLLIAGLE